MLHVTQLTCARGGGKGSGIDDVSAAACSSGKVVEAISEECWW